MNIMTDAVESKVTGIIQSLNGLEDDLDSLNGKVGDMKKQLTVKTLSEIDTLLEKTREMAMKEAEVIINAAKEKANVESTGIIQEGDSQLTKIESNTNDTMDSLTNLTSRLHSVLPAFCLRSTRSIVRLTSCLLSFLYCLLYFSS